MTQSFQSDHHSAVKELKEIAVLRQPTTDLDSKMDTLQMKVKTDNAILKLNYKIKLLKEAQEDHKNKQRQNVRIRNLYLWTTYAPTSTGYLETLIHPLKKMSWRWIWPTAY
ncbi:hypothetical protein FKM82_009337 [Ascaphus truei]